MKYNFTDRVRKCLALAREEAIRLGHDYVGTEHILFGLLREGEGVAAAALAELGVESDAVLEKLEASVRTAKARGGLGELPYTSRAKKVLEFSMSAAREMKHRYVGTEHLLLGLVMEEKGIAAQVLGTFGVTEETAKSEVVRLLGPAPGRGESGKPPFVVEIDDSSDRSIYEQIVARVREAVATGELTPGIRLPTVRRLADQLDIAPGTVARAYSELERLGVVVTEGARGTRVAPAGRQSQPEALDREALVGLLRPVAVAAFHMGASADDLEWALGQAMADIFGG